MLVIRPYRRERAVEYARRWATMRNPVFYDFPEIGGNCTNFVSQALYAGSCRMNGLGPFGEEVPEDRLSDGDVVQIGRDGEGFFHSMLFVGRDEDGTPLVAAQSLDVYGRRLDEYDYDFVRFIHILGVRASTDGDGCFQNVYDGISLQPTDDAADDPT